MDALQLQGAHFEGAHLEGAVLPRAHLEGAYLEGTHLGGAHLEAAHLEGALLDGAHLEGADLVAAHLERANLYRADLRRANLCNAHLEGTILWEVTFDARTSLADVTLGDTEHGFAFVADTAWNGVNLANVSWDALCSPQGRLGDDQLALSASNWDGSLKTPDATQDEYQTAARAYRQLSVALQAQGLTEQSLELGYRAQKLRHKVLELQADYHAQTLRDETRGRWVLRLRRRVLERPRIQGRVWFSQALDVVAGYGYKPGKGVATYLCVQAAFIALYLAIGAQNFLSTGHHVPAGSSVPQAAWTAFLQAAILSVTSFHGRAFLTGSAGNFVNNAPLPTALMFGVGAALEAVFGLLIEAILVATLIQRFFR